MVAAHFWGFAFSAAAATLRIGTISTSQLDGLRIIAKSANLTSALVDVGFLRLLVGRHTHILRGRNIWRIPTLITLRFGYTNLSQRGALALTNT